MDKNSICKWRIVEMEQWDSDYIDLVEPGYISLEKGGAGFLHFGCIDAHIDYRSVKTDDTELVEFSFEGKDEYDPICGRGKALINGMELKGEVFIHNGDESKFTCKPF